MKPLKTTIVEDEIGAANDLRFLLKEIAPEVEVTAVLSSIGEAVEWFSAHDHPDLAFFDIQLEDGLSFEVFNRIQIDFPVVFTTAFDEYAIKAFKVNSVDYLLKPIRAEDLRFSIEKYRRLARLGIDRATVTGILESISGYRRNFAFLVHYKDKMIPVPDQDFAFFYIHGGIVFGCTHSSKKYPIEYSIEELEIRLDSSQFFKANRQYIVNRRAIKEIEFYFNGRLLLKLAPKTQELVLVSKARGPVFKRWLKGDIDF